MWYRIAGVVVVLLILGALFVVFEGENAAPKVQQTQQSSSNDAALKGLKID
jgi:hypothetical protein